MDNFRERLTKNAEEFDGIVAELLGQCAAMRATFENILEYWNKDENEDAMKDALWHIIDVASEALSSNAGRELLEYKQWYEEAMVATNEAGFVGVAASEVIRFQSADIRDLKERLRIAEEQLRGVKAGVLVVCSAEELERLRKAEEYQDKADSVFRELCYWLGVGGYNSDGLMPPETADDKLRFAINAFSEREESLRAELREQSELLERCKKDAERYRKLRAWYSLQEVPAASVYVCNATGITSLDDAVDAAMEANNG